MTKEIILSSLEKEIETLQSILEKKIELYENLKNDPTSFDDYISFLQINQDENSIKCSNG